MSEQKLENEKSAKNTYVMASWILGIIALLMSITNQGVISSYFAVAGLFVGGVGLYQIEQLKGKANFAIICIIINIIALFPFIF